jgi:hypothetical protein
MAEIAVRLPELVRPGFEKLRSLSEPHFRQLVSALSSLPPTSYARALIRQIAEQLDPEGEKGIGEILEMVTTFFSGPSTLGLTYREFVAAILNGYEGKLSKTVSDRMRARILELLASETLFIASKSSDLLHAQPNTLANARILTDLRPIFHDDPSRPPAGALIIHQLKLTYHTDIGHEEFFVTVDAEDLAMLKRVIERAEAKASNIMRAAHSTQLKVVDEVEE